MKFINSISKYWGILIYLFVAVFAVLPFFNAGFFNIHDDTQIERVYQMSVALKDGMFPVRWVPDLGYGYGYAIFNYYSVFPYYIGGALVLLGFDILTATKLLFVSALIGSGVSMYLLVNRHFGNMAAIVSAVIYLYFPYHALNTYVRGDLAELFAYSLLPLIFFGLLEIHLRVDKNKSIRMPIVLMGVALALVVISHNLTAFMSFIFIGIFMVGSLIIRRRKKNLFFGYSLALILAFLLSSFYSVPAVLEMGYSNVTSVIGGGSHYADHFVCLSQLWAGVWGFGGSAPGCIDGISFHLGKLNIVLSLIALVVFLFVFGKTKKRFFILMSFISLFFSIFMTVEYSVLLWTLPFMEFMQFPWRFLNFTSFFIAIVIGFLVGEILRHYSYKFVLVLASLIIGVTIYTNHDLFVPQTIDNRVSEDYSSRENITWTVSRISDEYLPGGFVVPESKSEIPIKKIELKQGIGEVSIIQNSTNYIKASMDMETTGQLKLNIAYFPAWSVYINENKTSYIIRNNGLFVSVPEGRNTITARFIETDIEKIANALSILGILILIMMIIKRPRFIEKL